MDVINIVSKAEGLPDAPVVDDGQYYQPASMYFANGWVILARRTLLGHFKSYHLD